ncbi:hypothetical protein BHM03_00013919 [Ensete ventricosum]|nr:hypothetical protein BHM03_00013919 [Ensete ventricosum]
MTNDDMAVTSSCPRTTGPSTWLTRRGKLVGCKYGGANGRTTDLAQVRSNPQWSYGQPDIGKFDVITCRRMPHCKDDGHDGRVRRHEVPPPYPNFATPAANPRDGVVALDPMEIVRTRKRPRLAWDVAPPERREVRFVRPRAMYG